MLIGHGQRHVVDARLLERVRRIRLVAARPVVEIPGDADAVCCFLNCTVSGGTPSVTDAVGSASGRNGSPGAVRREPVDQIVLRAAVAVNEPPSSDPTGHWVISHGSMASILYGRSPGSSTVLRLPGQAVEQIVFALLCPA